MNSCSAVILFKYLVFNLKFSRVIGHNCFDMKICPKLKTCGLQKLDLGLGDWWAWYGKVLSCCYLVPSDTRVLEIYLLKNLKLSHDEFLYDEWLNSYHNYIFARLGKPTHRLLTLCWVWSTHVRPLSRGSSYSQDQDHEHSTQICYFYPGSMQ
jgi:hypothetical protein